MTVISDENGERTQGTCDLITVQPVQDWDVTNLRESPIRVSIQYSVSDFSEAVRRKLPLYIPGNIPQRKHSTEKTGCLLS